MNTQYTTRRSSEGLSSTYHLFVINCEFEKPGSFNVRILSTHKLFELFEVDVTEFNIISSADYASW